MPTYNDRCYVCGMSKILCPMVYGRIIYFLFAAFAVSAFVFGTPLDALAERLTFEMLAPPYRQAEAEEIARQLEEIGIRVHVQILHKSELRRTVKDGYRDAYLTDWGSAFFSPFDLAIPKLSSGGRGNYSFYANKRVDILMKEASISANPTVRSMLYRRVQEIVWRQAPWVFGFTLPRFDAVQKRVAGYTPSMDGSLDLYRVDSGNGGVLVVGLNLDKVQSFDPGNHRSRGTEAVLRCIFEGLVGRSAEGKVVPLLAKSWRLIGDRTYEFSLRKNVVFHDGTPCTAKDVEFTFQRILNPFGISGKQSPRRNLLGPLSTIVVVDDYTVRLILKKPFPVFLQSLVHFQIVPKAYVEKEGAVGLSLKPVGTGPFRMVHDVPGKQVTLKPFVDYWDGEAVPERVVLKLFPHPEERMEALVSGKADIIQSIPLAQAKEAEALGEYALLSIEGTRSCQIELNNKKDPFDDIRVRKALNFAIDWNRVFDRVYGGYGGRLATCFLPSGFGFDYDLQPHPYDPELARSLLFSAGYDVESGESQ